MAASSISCCLGPPALPKEARRPSSLRRACVAAAACAVVAADMLPALARDGAVVASRADGVAAAVGAPRAKAPPRWSDRRQCPPWRANSLENVVPENLPRPRASARRSFSSVSIPPAALAPAPDLVLPPFLAPRPGGGGGCFSL